MGIGFEQIVDADNFITEKYKCLICYDISKLPVRLSNCGGTHIFCLQCIDQWFYNREQQGYEDTCPACRAVGEIISLTEEYLREYKSLRRRCAHPKCEEISLIHEWDDHVMYCSFVIQRSNAFIQEKLFFYGLRMYFDDE